MISVGPPMTSEVFVRQADFIATAAAEGGMTNKKSSGFMLSVYSAFALPFTLEMKICFFVVSGCCPPVPVHFPKESSLKGAPGSMLWCSSHRPETTSSNRRVFGKRQPSITVTEAAHSIHDSRFVS